jgi:hypothetical protein
LHQNTIPEKGLQGFPSSGCSLRFQLHGAEKRRHNFIFTLPTMTTVESSQSVAVALNLKYLPLSTGEKYDAPLTQTC